MEVWVQGPVMEPPFQGVLDHIVQPLLPDLDGRADDALGPFQTDKPLRPTAGYNPVTTE
jgi:hypothetical protein